jgi:putative membrane protein
VTVVVWIFALLAAMIHIVVFVWESFMIGRPRVHQGIFGVPTADVPAIRLWAFGVGFYNLSRWRNDRRRDHVDGG